MVSELAMYVLSALILLLGGISLFIQKIYKVDKETGEDTEIDLPWFGKLKTNYPALAFAFIGAAMATYTFNKTCEVKDQWLIVGQFKAPESSTVDWSKGVLSVFPSFTPIISPNGAFEIQMDIPRRFKLEDIVEQISYNNWSGNTYIGARILVSKEYNSFKKHEPSILEEVGDKRRKYGLIDVSVAPNR